MTGAIDAILVYVVVVFATFFFAGLGLALIGLWRLACLFARFWRLPSVPSCLRASVPLSSDSYGPARTTTRRFA